MMVELLVGNVSKRPALEGVSVCVRCRKVKDRKCKDKKVIVLKIGRCCVDRGCPG